MKNYKLSTVLVSLYLVVYTLLHQAGVPPMVLTIMFVISPFMVLWMAYTILKFAPYNKNELQENEEWGYADEDNTHLN